MVDRSTHGDIITLRNNRIIGWVASAALVGTGSAITLASLLASRGVMGVFIGLVLIVPGIWVLPAMTRSWRFDDLGICRGQVRVMTWPQVTEVRVDDVRPRSAGLGPAHVRLRIHSASRVVDLTIYSYRDAVEVARKLDQRLPQAVSGREFLPRIAQAWQHLR